jgi:SPX domain protein involved in polyphosphate accumulation
MLLQRTLPTYILWQYYLSYNALKYMLRKQNTKHYGNFHSGICVNKIRSHLQIFYNFVNHSYTTYCYRILQENLIR